MESLIDVLGAKGCDDASLNEVAAACNLKEASLYHRFPNGKRETIAVLQEYV